jgi:hypothetical protein
VLLSGQVEYLKAFDVAAQSIDDFHTDAGRLSREVERYDQTNTLGNATGSREDYGVTGLSKLHERCQTVHRQIVFMRVALRLRRYRDQFGRLPEKLDDVLDDTMPKIRLEWFKNQPITYKRTAKGFRLEVPESILPPEERGKVHETPLSGDYGLEIEFKTIKPAKGGGK